MEMHDEVLGLRTLCKSNLAEARRKARIEAWLKKEELAFALNASKKDSEIQFDNSERALAIMLV